MILNIDGYSLYPELTVKKRLQINAYLRDLNKNRILEAYDYLANKVPLNKKIAKLSLGMKQEVALAQNFMCHSKLYFLFCLQY